MKLDKWDALLAFSSGVLTGAFDVLWTEKLDFQDAHKWGVEKAKDIVVKTSKKMTCYRGNDVSGAIANLEEKYPIPADKMTSVFGGGLQHHLRDFAHHPTPMGLVFSVMMQFTGCAYGTDVKGDFQVYELPGEFVNTGSFFDKIYAGIYTWFFHMISDFAGSSGSVAMGKEGTGLPGPFLSLLKELSSISGIKEMCGVEKTKNGQEVYGFSQRCSKLFNGTLLGRHDENGNIIKGEQIPFDLRTEMGIANQILDNQQYLPVIFNELIVRAFFSVRTFVQEIKENSICKIEDLNSIDVRKCLPWNSEKLKHMLMISSATFSAADITSAGVEAAVKNKGNKSGFAIDFLQGINYFGCGRFVASTGSEVAIAVEKLHDKYVELADVLLAKAGTNYIETKDFASEIGKKAGAIASLSTPAGFVGAAVLVYDELKESIAEYKMAKEDRLRIEALCEQNIVAILDYREQMEAAVSDYMECNLTVFTDAINIMDRAIKDDDPEAFIEGNAAIQRQLGRTPEFTGQAEFDDIMAGEGNFRL